jgi:hypothetical protein
MIPIIRTKLAEMLTERTKSEYCECPLLFSSSLVIMLLGFIHHEEMHYTITLSTFQGHRTYVLNNTFGPVPPPKKKGELPKEPLVELVRFSVIDYEQVIQVCLLVSPV